MEGMSESSGGDNKEKTKTWHRPTLPVRYQTSTIGASGLNCRVREGTGCTPAAPDTKKPSSPCRAAAVRSAPPFPAVALLRCAASRSLEEIRSSSGWWVREEEKQEVS